MQIERKSALLYKGEAYEDEDRQGKETEDLDIA